MYCASAAQLPGSALDGHLLEVTHTDGHRVQPLPKAAIPIGPGERYDAIVTLNNPGTWSLAVSDIANRGAVLVRGVVQYAASAMPVPSATFVPANLATGALLSYSQLAAFTPQGPITTAPNRNYNLPLAASMSFSGGSPSMIFTINGQAWPNVTPLALNAQETIQLNFTNTSGMMGSFDHPMHIHGHFWKLMGTAGGTTAPPIKDTVLIRQVGLPWSAASMQFLADNPGEWALHCHNADHMAMGMMNTFQYGGDADGDGIATSLDWDPLTTNPVLTISDSASAFAVGGNGSFSMQAVSGSPAYFYLGTPLSTPLTLQPLGSVWIDAPLLLGSVTSGVNHDASLAYAIPNAPALSGLRIGVQGVAFVPFAPGMLISTWQPVTIR